MNSFIMFHAERYKLILDEHNICYCDSFKRNQDPYIFAPRFLHSYCKINQLPISKMKKGDTIFWFTKDKSQESQESQEGKWFCDLVFVLDEIKIWNPITEDSFNTNYKNDYTTSDIQNSITHQREEDDHFCWADKDHPKGENSHNRITLFANSKESFQPLNSENNLIRMDEFCQDELSLDLSIIKGGPSGYPKKELDENQCNKILNYINEKSHKKLHGKQLQEIREKYERITRELFKELCISLNNYVTSISF